jgi:phosphopantothenoylcysteine decarboxylase/phosphopantothenate--cysteine ligase
MSTSIPPRAKKRPERILLGVTGGIAAYKSCLLLRRLVDAGHDVRVVMTKNATRFVAPLTFSSLSGNPVPEDPFLTDTATRTEHIDHSLWADRFIVAPATANILGKVATGIADDFLSTLLCAFDRQVIFAPAMNHRMWANPAVRRNVAQLKADGHLIVEPGEGWLACGETGAGRMAEPDVIHRMLNWQMAAKPLAGRRIVISAGPTVEDIDEVRFLSNRSTGKMGLARAEAAWLLGAESVLVAGPGVAASGPGICRRDVRSAAQMADTVLQEISQADVLIMAAAVADYTPDFQPGKRKKHPGDWNLNLHRTKDILLEAATQKGKRLHVGFALEVENERQAALEKLKAKQLDLICVNNPREEGAGFGTETNRLDLLFADGREENLPKGSKQELAHEILMRLAGLLSA